MNEIIEDIYGPLLTQHGFAERPSNGQFSSLGKCWELSSEIGEGFYWTYFQKDLFDIKIHDFFFHEDSFMEFCLPECLSITQYDSISGEEITPYRRLAAGCIKTFIGGIKPYKILIHKKIPVRCIGIEIMPAYYEDYLKQQYPDEYKNPRDAFLKIDQTTYFPEMNKLLKLVRSYRGTGIAAKLYYEGKVAEAVSLVVEKKKSQNKTNISISIEDIQQLGNVTAYINDHYAFDIPLERLAKIACMGTTKLKYSFKQQNGCTVTEYIQQRRMSQSEHMLSNTDLTIGQIANTVGYSSASRFAELFQRSTGLQPSIYRKTTCTKR